MNEPNRDKRQIDGGMLVFHLFLFLCVCRLHFMCKNKCAHKTFQYKCLTQWYYFSALFKREYIPFDLGENARNQMKHMHVNESILE